MCSKTFSVGSMGVKAFERHAKGEKHELSQPWKDSRDKITSPLIKIDESQSSGKGKLPIQKQQTLFTVADNQLVKQAEVKCHLKLFCASSLSVRVTTSQNYPCSQTATLQKILLVPKQGVNTSCLSEQPRVSQNFPKTPYQRLIRQFSNLTNLTMTF